MVIGHQKGRDTRERTRRNFGMTRPEGYRKALRLMKLAEKFNLPVFTFIDTPGAYPGIDAEERNQSEAIGRNILELTKLRVPVIATIIGEGGSGGALAPCAAGKTGFPDLGETVAKAQSVIKLVMAQEVERKYIGSVLSGKIRHKWKSIKSAEKYTLLQRNSGIIS